MQESCRNCHASTQVDMYYRRFDAGVLEFNRLASEAVTLTSASDSRSLAAIKAAAMKGKIGAAMLSPLHVRDGATELLDYQTPSGR
jgi:hypothetical protein